MLSWYGDTPITKIDHPVTEANGIDLYIKRMDMNHLQVSGNKAFKLKYNLEEARKQGHDTILTFGGAYSNHIHATAYACHELGFKSIGIIRGEQSLPLNPTLRDAESWGMNLLFVSREYYRQLTRPEESESLHQKFGTFYLVPEGGANTYAVKGCSEMLTENEKKNFDIYCCACGTGGTIAGIISSLGGKREVIGFPILGEGEFLYEKIAGLTIGYNGNKFNNWKLNTDYSFGGYARWNQDLVRFINEFQSEYRILLDPIYTGKLLYGLIDMAALCEFKPGSRILAIHTGGLQGIRGFNQRFGNLLLNNQEIV